MIWILLLVLTPSACGRFAIKTTTRFYQAEENNDVTITWDSQTKADLTRTNLICVSRPNRFKVLYQMVRGFEDPAFAHKQFSRRVQLDRDALKEGQLRLYLSLVTAEDSGDYWCELTANYNTRTRRWGVQATVHFILNVTRNSYGQISASEKLLRLLGGPQQRALVALVLPLTVLMGAALLVRYVTVCWGSRIKVYNKRRRDKKERPNCGAAAIKTYKKAQA